MKLSVFIITLNEKKNIRRCLESVRWADEIVVLDSGSSDGTENICREYTQNFHFNRFQDYADQKNIALSMTRGDWVLSLDADEEVTPELKKEILAVLEDAEYEAYRIRRRSRIFGRWMRATGTQEDAPVRLMKRDSAKFEQPIHEIVRVNGKIGMLKNPLLHYTYELLADYMERLNRYTSMEARWMLAQGKKTTGGLFLTRAMAMFVRLFFLKGGIMDGRQGFLFSVLSAFYVFVKNAKHKELLKQ